MKTGTHICLVSYDDGVVYICNDSFHLIIGSQSSNDTWISAKSPLLLNHYDWLKFIIVRDWLSYQNNIWHS